MSDLQFNLEDTMNWNIVFARSAYTNDIKIQMLNFAFDRSNPCMVCQTPETITLKNLTPKKGL